MPRDWTGFGLRRQNIYQYPTGRKQAAETVQPARMVVAEPTEEVGLVQGMTPDSKEEWWVALALDRLGVEYLFQVPVLGGRRLRGGIVVDFLLMLPPSQVPLNVKGAYWHRQEQEERLYDALLEEIYGVPPVNLNTEDLTSKEATYQVVKESLHV
jgi:hypothetical protein